MRHLNEIRRQVTVYGKVSGDLESAEFKDKVEFARPNGKTY